MQAFGEETGEVLLRLRNGVGMGDADRIEAMLSRYLSQRGLERVRVGQKSRSA
jgi:hypothetical protein